MTILVALHIPDGSQQGRTVWIDPTKSAPIALEGWRDTGAKKCADNTMATTELTLAQAAPIPLRLRRGTVALVRYKLAISGELSHIAPQQNGLEKELDQAQDALVEKSQELARLDDVLAPVRGRESSIRECLRNTHFVSIGRYPHSWDYAKGPPPSDYIVFNPAGASKRKNMFLELDDIAREWGSIKTARRAADQQVKWLRREIIAIKKKLEKETAKKGKRASHAKI